tara:strand:+ start:33 stop:251 length:219 start_codon:yes stop_codon:yes gene_type:complete
MENYRQLNKEESNEISNVSCQQEMDNVLSKYYMQVFKVVNICEEGQQNIRYFLAEVERDLKGVKNSWIKRVV